ncbi:MAG: polynucleotide adenylyltransferase PcnB [Spirochaetia bacterium]
MLFRYGTAENGSIEKKAHIYTQEEHGIDARLVDPDALWVVRRLRGAHFHAYIVGGAVRDLLVGRTPKDFDVATDAHPMQIKRLFRSARVIGRRFRLVHVYCAREKYIEVSTFRSRVAGATMEHAAHPDAGNYFGTMEEDAGRRDFTVNALYYCPIDHHLIDYVEAFPDLRQRRLRTLVRAEVSFAEDPVRMIRAVKYASLLGFPFPNSLAGLVRRMRESILSCSRERVTEEVFKILTSGAAADIFELAHRLRLFEVIFPAHAKQLQDSHTRLSESPLGIRLKELDGRAAAGDLLDRSQMFGFLFIDLARGRKDILEDPDADFLLQQFIRAASEPLFPSKKDLAVAAQSILGTTHPGRRVRSAHSPAGQRAAESARGLRGAAAAPGADGATSASGGAVKRRRRRGRGRGGRRRAGKGPSPGPRA